MVSTVLILHYSKFKFKNVFKRWIFTYISDLMVYFLIFNYISTCPSSLFLCLANAARFIVSINFECLTQLIDSMVLQSVAKNIKNMNIQHNEK